MFGLGPAGIVVILAVMFLFSAVKILREYERAVIFRLGRLMPHRGPGIVFVIPVIETMQRIDMRTLTLDVPSQDVITRDNVSVKVNAVLYFRVLDPSKALVEIENYLFATSQLAQTTLRSVCGQAELDELLSERDKINTDLQEIVDTQTDPWGIKVSMVEVKHIDLPQEMHGNAFYGRGTGRDWPAVHLLERRNECEEVLSGLILAEFRSQIAHCHLRRLRHLRHLRTVAADQLESETRSSSYSLLRFQTGFADNATAARPDAVQ